MTGTAIKTNGEGRVTTGHLNLTRTMADPLPYVPPDTFRNRFSTGKAALRQVRREARNGNKLPYAGAK